MTPTNDGGTRLIDGRKFDFEQIYVAYVRLIDALTEENGGTSTLGTRYSHIGRVDWPRPGKSVAARVWARAREAYDVVREPLHHQFGTLTIHAYLLGTSCAVRDSKTGIISLQGGAAVSTLQSAPWIRVAGFEENPAIMTFPTAEQVSRVEPVFLRELASLGAVFRKKDGAPTAVDGLSNCAQFGFIDFPHEVFGAGYGPLRVRCVDEHGNNLPAQD